VVPEGTVVVNADESAWVRLDTGTRRRLSYGVEGDAALTATSLELGPEGTRFELSHEGRALPVSMPLLGRFNVENALAAAGIALAAGRRVEEVADGLARAPAVPGRMELVTDHPCPVVIDYAHTPDALACVLDTLRRLTRGRLIVLFGAGGDRDPAKRPLMGRVVAERADIAIVTSDNPRTEDPDAIIDGVIAGMGGAEYERVRDRRTAIGRALDMADSGDVVVLAGKGHEICQIVGRERVPFDEREIVLSHPSAGGRAA
jgi:UDP-N-acetylmuramyl-tripeptide synthetase